MLLVERAKITIDFIIIFLIVNVYIVILRFIDQGLKISRDLI